MKGIARFFGRHRFVLIVTILVIGCAIPPAAMLLLLMWLWVTLGEMKRLK